MFVKKETTGNSSTNLSLKLNLRLRRIRCAEKAKISEYFMRGLIF